MTDVDITSLHAKNPKDLWKKVYERVFPQEVVQSSDRPIIDMQHFSDYQHLCFLARMQINKVKKD